jgi:hypothetical protein
MAIDKEMPKQQTDSVLYDPKHWELRAEELRTVAATMRDPEARAIMTGVINTYEQMAQRAAVLQKLFTPMPKKTHRFCRSAAGAAKLGT